MLRGNLDPRRPTRPRDRIRYECRARLAVSILQVHGVNSARQAALSRRLAPQPLPLGFSFTLPAILEAFSPRVLYE
jgi:hypothetical protein